MESNRLNKVNNLLQQDMADIFRIEAGKIQKSLF